MNRSTILFAGVSQDRNQLDEKFSTSWITSFANTAEEAIEKFQQLHQDIVVTGSKLDQTEIQKLGKLFLSQHPDLLFLAENEIEMDPSQLMEQLKKKQKDNKPSIQFKDDALKNAGLNIQTQ
jgi:predicted RNA-binding protein with PIN domain